MPVARAADGTTIFYERTDPPAALKRSGSSAVFEHISPASEARVLLAVGPLGLDSRLWRLVTPDAVARGYTVLALDNRGCGRSGTPWRPWTLRTMADDAVRVLDHAGFARAHVCGPSLGGLIAQELAISHRERVGALALASTTPSLPRVDLLPYPAIAGVFLTPARRLLAQRSREERTRRLLRMLVSSEAAEQTEPGSGLWRLAEELAESPPATRGQLWQLLAAASGVLWHRLARIRAPTLIMHGTDDRIVPPRSAAVLTSRIPGAQLSFVEGAGHALVLERPDEITRMTLEFLAAHDELLRLHREGPSPVGRLVGSIG
jgi:3-oxoadipate enol-lactonase